MNDELTQAAMEIILHAGDARGDVRRAYEALAANDGDRAASALEQARTRVRQAHRAQTALIQAEAGGTTHTLTLLFSHAQDTLMTINSEVITAGNLVAVFAALDVRLTALESAGNREVTA